MRYLFVSDVHGEYDKMIASLNAAKFNRNTDTLVCLGDMFDRGAQSREVLEFILNLPNCIIVWGNHDLRLRDLVYGRFFANDVDRDNGVLATIKSFIGTDTDFQSKSNSPSTLNLLLNIFRTDDRCGEIRRKLYEYFDRSVWGLEFKDLIAVHGWIPTSYIGTYEDVAIYNYWPNWRFWSTKELWAAATWMSAIDAIIMDCGPSDKKMLVGHIHAWRARQYDGDVIYEYKVKEKGQKDWVLMQPDKIGVCYETHNVIFIDGCVTIPEGKVIVYEYNSEKEPIVYDRTIVRQ